MEVLLQKGFKYKLEPTEEQKEFFLKNFGCARMIYNKYIESLYNQLEAKGYTGKTRLKESEISIASYTIYSRQYDFMKEVNSQALDAAKRNFKKALRRYVKDFNKGEYTKGALKRKKNLGIEPTFRDLKGLPRYKSKKKGDFSYTSYNQSNKGKWDCITLKDNELKIPKLKSKVKVKVHRQLPKNSLIKNCVISMTPTGKFYVSLCVEYIKDITPKKPEKAVGLDYSQKDFFVSSDGERANYPHFYRKSEERLKKLKREYDRKVDDSKNKEKARRKYAKLSEKVANQRKDFLHKLSRKYADIYDVVIVEDLDLRNLAQTLSLGKNLHDNGFGMFRLFLQYKLEEQGKQFIKIDKWYPSSKKCNNCGKVKDNFKLSDRIYECDCGYTQDRDINAALNILDAGTALIAW